MSGSMTAGRKSRVTYHFDPEIGTAYYGNGHPMKPHRVRMAHSLIVQYGLYKHMTCVEPQKATKQEMAAFHTDEYISFLESVTTKPIASDAAKLYMHNVFEDCPVFPGLYDFCRSSAGSSIGGAVALNCRDSVIAINWSGGLHHAMRSAASGFCYVNDIVLAILELLKMHSRVMYIDIDVHHGDGVEAAFYGSDRVMTLSFHKYGNGFFPETGNLKQTGVGPGKGYSLNVPLRSWINDEEYEGLFQKVVGAAVAKYKPEAIVMQCGADSLARDKLGEFNLSSQGHADCVRYVKAFCLPLLLLGGGGYTIENVARCWALETAVAVGVEISADLPRNDFSSWYHPEHQLYVLRDPSVYNENTPQYIQSVYERICEQLRALPCAPSVPFNEIPYAFEGTNAKRPNSDTMDSHVGCYGNDSQPLPTGVAYTLGDPPHTSTQPTGDERGVSAHTHTHTHTHTNTPSAETEAGCGCDETSASVEKAQVFI